MSLYLLTQSRRPLIHRRPLSLFRSGSTALTHTTPDRSICTITKTTSAKGIPSLHCMPLRLSYVSFLVDIVESLPHISMYLAIMPLVVASFRAQIPSSGPRCRQPYAEACCLGSAFHALPLPPSGIIHLSMRPQPVLARTRIARVSRSVSRISTSICCFKHCCLAPPIPFSACPP